MKIEDRMKQYNINPDKNYERIDNGDIFTGKQIVNLLEIASPAMQAIILLGITPTDKPATNPKSKYGAAEK